MTQDIVARNTRLQNADLYRQHGSLDEALFREPTAIYRGTPFWSWNTKLDEQRLLRQIDCFREMGFGGFHMHPRTGMATEYLGETYMQMVRACTEKARQAGMLAWLYDEDRWPSGYGGGRVTVDPQYRAKHLLFTPRPYGHGAATFVVGSKSAGYRTENGTLVARYDVVLDHEGRMAESRRLDDAESDENPKGRIWYAYVETAVPTSWFNNQTYVDTLSTAAIQRFIEVTHERYRDVVGEHFGDTIPAIFTDEPQFAHKQPLAKAHDTKDIIFPITSDFFASYAETYRQRLEDDLPEVFWERADGAASVARYRYHDHVAERFARAYADTIGRWCDEHGIALTGHMMEEPTLRSQTAALGEAMRSYRSFHLPGIDMLCDQHEYTTAKQAQSAAHQFKRPGVMSELYGVTNWDFSFVGHKAQGDWQAALGVTVRVPHLSWVSMAGEAKRDYPAAIDEHSPWYREYKRVEDYFSRLNVVLTHGQPCVRVGVIHPIESYWLAFGPRDQTALEREEREAAFKQVTNALLFGLVDFDYIAESLLPELCPDLPGAPITVGAMTYDVVIVPGMRTIRRTTLDRLSAFADAGGRLIFAGEVPELVDAEPSAEPAALASRSEQINLNRVALLQAVAPVREVEVREASGTPASTLLHQIREHDGQRYVFFCQTDRGRPLHDASIRLRGDWAVTQMDAMTGEQQALASERDGDWTVLRWSFPAHGSLLLKLTSGWQGGGKVVAEPRREEVGQLAGPVPITLSEPNVLLLDQARWRLAGDEQWAPEEEILRLDNLVRKRVGLPHRTGHICQPWADTEPTPVLAEVEMAFRIVCDVDVSAPQLALEGAGKTTITLDGQRVPSDPDGYFVDEAIQTVSLPPLSAGEHELRLTVPFHRKTDLEWCYLLGDFGVQLLGRSARIVAPVRELAFGDWTHQGLPFYAGNVTYHCQLAQHAQPVVLRFPKFKAPLLSVTVDDRPGSPVAFAPFECAVDLSEPGPHRVDVTAFGNRVNSFGAVHNADEGLKWYGPNAWRQVGDAWSYEYQLRPMGLLVAPRVMASIP